MNQKNLNRLRQEAETGVSLNLGVMNFSPGDVLWLLNALRRLKAQKKKGGGV